MVEHPPEHFRLVALTDRVWCLPPSEITDRPVLGVIAGERATLVVDTGASVAHAGIVLGEIDRLGLPPVRFAVLTHSHWDHVFGSFAFPDAVLAAHRLTRERVAAMADLAWTDDALDARVAAGTELAFSRDHIRLELPDRRDLSIRVPELAFADTLELDLGGLVADCMHVGGDHADDSVVVCAGGVAFLGDCAYGNVHGPDYRYTYREIRRLAARLSALAADTYLWGHDAQPAPRERFLAELARLEQIGAAVEEAGGVLETAERLAGGWRDDDERENAEAFLAGWRLGRAPS